MPEASPPGVHIDDARAGDTIFSYIIRKKGEFDPGLYRSIIGAANEFKEGDRIIGLAAADEDSRAAARRLLANTAVKDIRLRPALDDPMYDTITADLDPAASARVDSMKLGELRDFLRRRDEDEIIGLLPGLSSDVVGCLVKLMTEEDLVAVGSKLHHALPGTMIGARGYLGARIQPNSPTDNPTDILWQVMSGFSFAVGDVLLGSNPVSSEPESVALVENTLLDIRRTFGLEDVLPHSVLSHIDIQALIEQKAPGTTGIWFQSLAGSTQANAVFDLSLEKLLALAQRRSGKYGFYFETGQGGDFTNGQGQGVDMVIHESRKYGLARFLKRKTAEVQQRAGLDPAPWVHVNDVAGFIGPEVFRTREQLVRCCLEDIVMGKLHGLTIGLDICSTLHMDVSLDDLDWCMDRIAPGCPAYLMALPTKMDPMLGYLTTSFQDHLRLRDRFGLKVNDAMRRFFEDLGVIDAQGRPSEHFGQPLRVWTRYRRAKGDQRPLDAIEAEGREQMSAVRARGVPLAEGRGAQPWDLTPELDREIRDVYHDSKKCLWTVLSTDFVAALPRCIQLATTSRDRADYILHPQTGERLAPESRQAVEAYGRARNAAREVQIVISDGLNANAIMDRGNLAPYLAALNEELERRGLAASPDLLVVRNGRVRVGYRIGEILFGGDPAGREPRCLVHLIGERPGGMHHTFSAYLAAPKRSVWSQANRTDHNIARVVSGLAATTSAVTDAAAVTVKIIKELLAK
ncbi:MAG: ethanolamine ammonia-lyase subunit EutB [Pseudomonadota bacterium]